MAPSWITQRRSKLHNDRVRGADTMFAHWRGDLAIVASGLVGVSCTETNAPEIGQPSAIQIVSGDNQAGVVATQLEQPLVARVVDNQGRAVPGQIANFRITAGNGSVF